MMDEALERESARLKRSWDRHGADHLDRYLVSGAEDPRINVPSILTRAWIVDALFPGEFESLINEELRFGLCVTGLLHWLAQGHSRNAALAALERGDAGSTAPFVVDTYSRLQDEHSAVSDYITAGLCDPLDASGQRLPSSALDTFAWLWRAELAARSRAPLSVLEPACGSANEYRFLAGYGLAPFLRYTAFDISEKNIANARRRFPDADFRLGNVLDVDIEDDAYDLVFVHDLFEHLSERALVTALREVLRVTRRQARLSFFNLADIPEHRIGKTGDYHRNTLSVPRIVELVSQFAQVVDVIRISDLVDDRFGCTDYYNREAATLVVTV